jgi:hypothetical protein
MQLCKRLHLGHKLVIKQSQMAIRSHFIVENICNSEGIFVVIQ